MKADVRRDAVTPAPVASDALATIQDELSSSRSNSVAVMQIALMATHLDSDDLVFRAFQFHAWNLSAFRSSTFSVADMYRSCFFSMAACATSGVNSIVFAPNEIVLAFVNQSQ